MQGNCNKYFIICKSLIFVLLLIKINVTGEIKA